MYARSFGTPLQRHVVPASMLPWVGVGIGALATLALGLYPRFPSDILPLIK
jgi:hypothetical protein